MDENPGVSEGYRVASPWPLFVALGIPIAEIGILFGLVPLAVGGLLLFCGSIAGILHENEYVASAWRGLAVLSVFVIVAGGGLWYADAATESDLLVRAYSMIGTGVLLLLAGVGGELFARDTEPTV
ncbi:DUF7541 family protein [Halobaculum gomorrense]|uniref:Cox cluster protein n=1 Tax=Halobaculum gomorrense TaxID=43928 RepID=A0A1M5UY19_9EURY|nr:cox cluster protein [Halobaculum gomorrense]SHH67784.1 hypothetical protein SAMN05443636_3168 [Halobaculum gomorrense]